MDFIFCSNVWVIFANVQWMRAEKKKKPCPQSINLSMYLLNKCLKHSSRPCSSLFFKCALSKMRRDWTEKPLTRTSSHFFSTTLEENLSIMASSSTFGMNHQSYFLSKHLSLTPWRKQSRNRCWMKTFWKYSWKTLILSQGGFFF